MNKTVITVALLSTTLLLTQTIFARDATPDGTTTHKDLIQQKIDTRKVMTEDKMAAMKEKMASREAALKAKLQIFKDQRKAQIAERVNTTLAKINENQTNQMLKFIKTMTAILDRLETRVNQPTADIKNPVKAKLAIADARITIASASAAVTAQAQKDYTIQATSEAKIRQEAQDARNNLHTDLLGVRKLVIAAKQAVANSIRVAKSGAGTDVGSSPKKEGTASGQQ